MDNYNYIKNILSGVIIKENINSHISVMDGWFLKLGWQLKILNLKK